MRTNIAVITNLNVDDLERCMNISADIAPAFEDQARRWLDPNSGKALEPGVRERLVALLDRRSRTRSFFERWGASFSGQQPRSICETV